MDYPLWNAFLTMMWLFLWILWFFLLFRIISDIFRSSDLSGWGKAGWLIFVILLPLLGVLVYLIARGGRMQERQMREAAHYEDEFRSYVRDAAAPTRADQLSTLADLRDRGVLDEAEFQAAKQKALR